MGKILGKGMVAADYDEMMRLKKKKALTKDPKEVQRLESKIKKLINRNRKKKKSKASSKEKADSSQPPAEEPPVDIGRFDLRVGKVIWAQNHPLVPQTHFLKYVHLDDPRLTLIVTELAGHYKTDELEGEKDSLILCNLKPPTIYGMTSWAMALYAVKDGKVEMLNAPKGTHANKKVIVDGYKRRPDKPYMKPYKNIYETVIKDLWVNDERHVLYKGVPLQVKGREGFITSTTLTNCPVKIV